MDGKRTEAVTEEDDFSDLFGVSYFDDEPEADPPEADEPEQSEETASDEETAEEVVETANDAGDTDRDPDEDPASSEEDTASAEEDVESEDPEESGAEDRDNAEEVETEGSKPAEDAAVILEAIRAVDPAIETFNDLEDVGLFALLIDQGKTPAEALCESSPKLQAKLAEAQKAASKKHLRSTATSGRDDAIDMDAINTFRRMNPKMSEKEAIELYKRVK